MEISKDSLKHWVILVVDDEDDSLDVARRILLHYGAQVMTASGGDSAFQLARQHPPDVVISDLSMPGGDGWSLVKTIRNDAELASLPVIALTAHAMIGDEDRVLGAGFSGYLSKPVMPRQMIADLISILRTLPETSGRFEGE